MCVLLFSSTLLLSFLFCRSSPARPFISACVADTMAAEIIGSLREMLMPKEGEASKFWLDGIKKVCEVDNILC